LPTKSGLNPRYSQLVAVPIGNFGRVFMATKKNPAANPVVQTDVKGFSAKPQPTPEPISAPISAPTPEATPAPLPAPPDPSIELKAKIAELQVKLTAQVATIDDLKTQLKQLPSLQAALTKSEAAARQLASLNATLQAENASLKAPAPAKEPVKALATVESSPLSNARPSLMMRSVFPNEALPGGIAEQEIGWFD
jgi:uncharacterized coiled-coil protein SlyX